MPTTTAPAAFGIDVRTRSGEAFISVIRRDGRRGTITTPVAGLASVRAIVHEIVEPVLESFGIEVLSGWSFSDGGVRTMGGYAA